MSESAPLLTVKAVAVRLSVDEETVRRLVHAGDLVGHRVRRLLRIDPASVEVYLCRSRVAVATLTAPTSTHAEGATTCTSRPSRRVSPRSGGRSTPTTPPKPRRLGEYLAGRGPSRAPASATAELPLARIVEAYLTAPHGWTRRAMQSADNRAAAWLEWCHARGLTLPSHLTGDHAQQWVKDRLAAGVRHSTFNRDRSVVRGIFQWASHPDRALCAETAFARLPQLREDLPQAAAVRARVTKDGER